MITFAFCYVVAFYGLTIGMFMGSLIVEKSKEEESKIKSPETRVSTSIANDNLLPNAIDDWDQRWKESQ